MADVHSQNTAMKRDMADLLSIVNKLREENETYRQNFENLRAAHTTLQQQAQALGQQASQASEAARIQALEHDSLLRSLKAQLDAKSREFDDMRERMLPTRELDMIRIRIAEEMDGPHRAHTLALAGEIEKFRSMYYELRREHELFKAKHETVLSESREALQEVTAKYDTEIQSLTLRLAQQQQQDLDDKADSNRHKSLVREVTELQQRLRQALIEIEDTRAEAEKFKGEITQRTRTHARQVADMEGGSRSMMTEKAAIEAKCTGLEGLVSDLQRQNRMLSEQVNLLELNKCDIRAQMDDTLAEYRRQLDELKRALEESESLGKREKEALARELSETSKHLTEVRQREKELSSQLAMLTKEFSLKIKKAREEDTTSARAAAQARAIMEERVAVEEREHLAAVSKLDLALQEKTALLSQTTTALKTAEVEVKNLADKARTLQVALTDREAELAANGKLLESLQTANSDFRGKLHAAELQEQALRATVDKLSGDISEMQANLDSSVRRAVSEVSAKYQSALDQDAEKTRKIRSCSKKLRKYKTQYGQLRAIHERVASSLHHQVDLLASKLDRATLEKQAHNQSLSAEITKLRSQINNKIREQAELEVKSQILPETSASLPPSVRPLSHSLPLQLHMLDLNDRKTRAELLSLNEHLSTLQQYQKGSMDSLDTPSTTLMELNNL